MNTQLDELSALAEIDPAPPADPWAHTSPQAQQLLANVLGADEASEEPSGLGIPAPRRQTRRRWLLASGAAAAGIAALLTLPVLTADSAYSSWTTTPTSLPPDDVAVATDACQQMWEDVGSGVRSPAIDLSGIEVQLAERRGEFAYLVLATDTHTMDCLTRTGNAESETYSAGSQFDHSRFGLPADDGLSAASVSLIGRDGVMLLFFNARVGDDVDHAVAHVPGVGDVETTVEDGMIAAWAPELTPDEARDGIGVTLHLSDGRSVEISPAQLREAGIAD